MQNDPRSLLRFQSLGVYEPHSTVRDKLLHQLRHRYFPPSEIPRPRVVVQHHHSIWSIRARTHRCGNNSIPTIKKKKKISLIRGLHINLLFCIYRETVCLTPSFLQFCCLSVFSLDSFSLLLYLVP